jgi:hypothetical protein
MLARVARIAMAGGLALNAALVRHPVPLAGVQALLAVVVLSGWGGPVVLAAAALALLPLPVAEVRRSLSHVPLACHCQRTSGRAGWWPVAGAVADGGLIVLAVALGRATAARHPSEPLP